MLIVPIQDLTEQTVKVTLAGQSCSLYIRQNAYGLFCDVSVNNTLIIGGVICQNLNRIVRDLYLGFIGDFMFLDNQGTTDPVSPGLGTRYSLCYLEVSDLGGLG